LESPDGNQNGLPDAFEKEYGVSDPKADPDLDGLTNIEEYWSGTNPLDSDTDDGGEGDGSEVLMHKSDPLDPRDDGIKAPQFLQAKALSGAVRLFYDARDPTLALSLYRRFSRGGEWVLRTSQLPPGGEYDDPADNGVGYFYRLLAMNRAGFTSAGVDNGAEVTPSKDPQPPEAIVIINKGEPTTPSPKVNLYFAPYETEGVSGQEAFNDITEIMLSNDPFLTGAKWQPFEQGIPWTLGVAIPGELGSVYVRFRDLAGNESVGVTMGMITFLPNPVRLPLLFR
jgi:hypothetical protein